MIVFLLQAALGPIGPQALPPAGCAAFLWTRAQPPQLAAMATAGSLRLSLDGKAVDLPRLTSQGPVVRGLPANARYTSGDLAVTLEMSAVERPDLADGAVVPDATLTVERAGRDTVVAPAAGLIGCAPAR